MWNSVFQIISSCVISYIKSVILKLIFENKTLGTHGTAAVRTVLLIVLHLHSFFPLIFLPHLSLPFDKHNKEVYYSSCITRDRPHNVTSHIHIRSAKRQAVASWILLVNYSEVRGSEFAIKKVNVFKKSYYKWLITVTWFIEHWISQRCVKQVIGYIFTFSCDVSSMVVL
jgi:hypothetical protein